MARALWTGSLSFGLVSIPVEIHSAVKDKGPRFRLLRKTDKSPIRFQRVAERDREVVEWEQIVKGYEYAKGQFIVLTPEDFEPESYDDSYRESVLELIKRKAAGKEIDLAAQEEPEHGDDLAAALEASLGAGNGGGGRKSEAKAAR